MQAIQVKQTGGPEVLTLVDIPTPTPKPNEALVEIKASGVNFIDVYLREGRYPAPLPFINGQEGAGIVREVGAEVRKSNLVIVSRTQARWEVTPNMPPYPPHAW